MKLYFYLITEIINSITNNIIIENFEILPNENLPKLEEKISKRKLKIIKLVDYLLNSDEEKSIYDIRDELGYSISSIKEYIKVLENNIEYFGDPWYKCFNRKLIKKYKKVNGTTKVFYKLVQSKNNVGSIDSNNLNENEICFCIDYKIITKRELDYQEFFNLFIEKVYELLKCSRIDRNSLAIDDKSIFKEELNILEDFGTIHIIIFYPETFNQTIELSIEGQWCEKYYPIMSIIKSKKFIFETIVILYWQLINNIIKEFLDDFELKFDLKNDFYFL